MQHEIIQIGKKFGGFCRFFYYYYYFLLWADMWVVNFTLFFLALSRLKFQTWICHGRAFHCGVFFKLFVYFLNKIQKHGWMLACNIFIKKEVILEIGMLDVDSAYTWRKGIKRCWEIQISINELRIWGLCFSI
jgi:hypothetical protein